jgi:amino acid adenylation domain-containing protein
VSVMGLLERLKEKNVTLTIKGDELVVQGKRQALTPELLTHIRENKTALVELIKAGEYVGPRRAIVDVPPNLIPTVCDAITPEMLPLAQLSAAEIERITSSVPGGAANIQDIYPLAPLQEGILFHHLLATEGDVYLTPNLLSFDTRARLDRFLQALQAVIDRHDILRTAMLWEDLREPMQVVWRQAPLTVEEISLESTAGNVGEELRTRFDPRHYRLDIRRAPLMRALIAHDARERRWMMLSLYHHLSVDHTTFEILLKEVQAYLLGRAEQLPAPLPFRNLVAQARQGVSLEEHESFFRAMLGDVDEPTAPFGLINVQGDGSGIREARREVDAGLAIRLRRAARALGVGAASLCHVATALVLARVSAPVSKRDDVVFGTVLLGRMQGGEGSDRALGLFMNTLPIRIRVGEQSVAESIGQTHRLLTELLRHEHAPLALAQRCSKVAAPTPLFSVFLNYRHGATPATGEKSLSAWEGIELLANRQRTNYPFHLDVDDVGEGFLLTVQVESPIEPDRICAYMHTTLEQLVAALDKAPTTPLRNLNALPASESHRLLIEWNETGRPYPNNRCVHHLFEEQVEKTPEAVALVFEGQGLTYRELNARANLLAGALVKQGVGPEAPVGLCLERSLEMMVALLGVLKAGGAYVPLDPEYPSERLVWMLEDAEVKVLLTEKRVKEKTSAVSSWAEGPVLCLDSEWEAIGREREERVDTGVVGENLAYVLYTSGSTGRPKGAQISHRGLVNFTLAMKERLELIERDRILQFASLSFDVSAEEIYPTLCSGATVVLARSEEIDEPAALQQVLERNEVTGLELPTAYWHEWVKELGRNGGTLPPSLRFAIVGGEPPLREKVAKWLEYGVSLFNAYGLTETAITNIVRSIEGEIEKDELWRELPIGKPIANNQIYILNSEQMPTPMAVNGEIYIGGAGLGRAYQRKPELTAERFVPHPLGSEPGGRLYRTGDLGVYRADGEIEFLGRRDHQVKVRGYRIELGEIEAVLRQHESVEQALVLLREQDEANKQLVAYIVPKKRSNGVMLDKHTNKEGEFYLELNEAVERGAVVMSKTITQFLRERLPLYMVPSAYALLDQMPLTANGKVDRQVLLRLWEERREGVGAYVAPSTPVEELLCGMWSEVLKAERVGVRDNFFELGGHSLLATQVISRVRTTFQVELPLRVLFERSTISELAESVDQALKSGRGLQAPPLGPASREGKRGNRLPLSFAQQRLWFLDQLAPDSLVYNIPGAVRLEGRLELEVLERVINEIVRRHEVLRTRFEAEEGEPAQVIDEWEERRLEVEDLRGMPAEEREEAARRITREEAMRGFDLSRGPLLRVKVLKLEEEEHVLLFTMHHIVSDEWSMGVLVRDVGALYQAYSAGMESPLEELPIQYADFAVWQREWLKGEALEEQMSYWRKQLEYAPELVLPTRNSPKKNGAPKGASYAQVIPADVASAVKRYGERKEATLFMLLLTAFAIALHRLTLQRDLVIGTDIANRNRAETEPLIGFFINELLLRIKIEGDPTFDELARQIRETALDAYLYQDVPFDKVVETLNPARRNDRAPLIRAKLVVQNAPRSQLTLPSLTIGGLEGVNDTDINKGVKCDFLLTFFEREKELVAHATYNEVVIQKSTTVALLHSVEGILAIATGDPTLKLSALMSKLTDIQRRRQKRRIADSFKTTESVK